MNTYDEFVAQYIHWMIAGEHIPLGCYKPIAWPELAKKAPVAMIFSPHPDDEILMAAPLAIRLRREGYRIVNVAMTLGRKEQRGRRAEELKTACNCIGFETFVLEVNGFDSVSKRLRKHEVWLSMINALAEFIKRMGSEIIIVHHQHDAHHEHQGTALLVRGALACIEWSGTVFEGEYWSHVQNPNLLLEVSAHDLARMLEAVSFHQGELARNPYHLRWPALLSDNVRRSELVLGRGTAAPLYNFAAMYRRNQCRKGKLLPKPGKSLLLGATEPIKHIL